MTEDPFEILCRNFALELGGTILDKNDGLCVIMKNRALPITIAQRPSRSPLTTASMFSFESIDVNGIALCLGETVILEEEINPFISALRNLGIMVTAIHNHWLYTDPPIFYIHWISIDNPIMFAMKSASAYSLLKV